MGLQVLFHEKPFAGINGSGTFTCKLIRLDHVQYHVESGQGGAESIGIHPFVAFTALVRFKVSTPTGQWALTLA